MLIVVARVAHQCADGRRVQADVERDGKYWWGYVDGSKLDLSITVCPICGDKLPTSVEAPFYRGYGESP